MNYEAPPVDLQVIVSPCDKIPGQWLATSVEVDYMAQGDGSDGAIHKFVAGFLATVAENCLEFGSAERFLQNSHGLSAWHDLFKANRSWRSMRTPVGDDRVPFGHFHWHILEVDDGTAAKP